MVNGCRFLGLVSSQLLEVVLTLPTFAEPTLIWVDIQPTYPSVWFRVMSLCEMVSCALTYQESASLVKVRRVLCRLRVHVYE